MDKALENPLWTRVNERLASPATSAERRRVAVRERVEEYLQDVELLPDVVNDILRVINETRQLVSARSAKLAKAGDAPPTVTRARSRRSEAAHWQLLRDLDLIERGANVNPWSEFELEWRGWRVWGDVAAYQPRIIISFDHRMSIRQVATELQREWKTLRSCGVVPRRPRRPLQQHAIDLVRLVCLDLPQGSWPERLRAWNQKHRRAPYDSWFLLQRDFGRAEEQLTGHRFGLEHLYNRRDEQSEKRGAPRVGRTRADREKSRMMSRVAANKRITACLEKVTPKGGSR